MRGFGHRIGDPLRVPRRGVRRVLAGLVTLLLAAGLGVSVALSAAALGLGLLADTPSTRPPPPPAQPQPLLVPVPAGAPLPSSTGLTRALGPLASRTGLGTLTGAVLDPAAGTTLWQRDETRALVPGSTGKLLAAAAALLALDHQARLVTTVVAGPNSGTVMLVGGGDPTLSALPAGKESVYPGAAKLDDLVAQVRAKVSGPIRSVVIDVGRWTGPTLAPGWLAGDVAAGFITPIVPLMLDGGRTDPTAQDGARTGGPAQAAGRELARRLGVPPAAVTVGTALPGATVLGQVNSPIVEELVGIALRNSDNVLAEALAREVARRGHAEASFSGAAVAVRQVLAGHGIDASGASMVDGSGLSTADRVPARLLGAVLAVAAGPADARGALLRPLLDGLPVAGGTGTLGDRFTPGTAAASGRGFVRAKTGTLTAVSSLAGVVSDVDGRVLVFALMSNGASPATVRPRLDALAATLRACGCR